MVTFCANAGSSGGGTPTPPPATYVTPIGNHTNHNDVYAPTYFWGGNIETTSFDLAIFGTDGTVFKKTVGFNGLSCWARLSLVEGNLVWSVSPKTPVPGSECANIQSVWFSVGEGLGLRGHCNPILHFFIGPEENIYSWRCQHDEFGTKPCPMASACGWFGANGIVSQQSGQPAGSVTQKPLIDLYRSSTPLSEIYTKGGQSFDGSAKDWPPLEPNRGEWSGSDTIETRTDPFDYVKYSEREFQEHYGSLVVWDMMCPVNEVRRKMIGDIIFYNKNTLSTKNVNFLIDKIIGTFM